jgi:hypothetical protein
MPLRKHTKASHSNPVTLKNAVALLLLLGIVGILIAYAVKSEVTRTPVDLVTLCPTDTPPTAVTVLLLDMSEGFTEAQALKIKNELEQIIATVPRFGLIEGYAVDRITSNVTTPVVHRCNPGTGEELNRLYQNPDLARTRWKKFSDDLNAELDRLMARPPSATSPIFEAVQATALRTFNLARHTGIPRRLVIVSDLLQNVPGKLSQYDGTLSFKEFKQSPYFAEVRADLSGVTVTALYLVRPRAPQPWPAHYKFWEEYFLLQGGTVERVEPVYGAHSTP